MEGPEAIEAGNESAETDRDVIAGTGLGEGANGLGEEPPKRGAAVPNKADPLGPVASLT